MMVRFYSCRVLLTLCFLTTLPAFAYGGKGGGSKPGRGGGAGAGGGDEEIIIPLGTETVIPMGFGGNGGGGGGFSIPLDPSMFAGPQGGSMGFEETEEIGPDGKPHIISEKSFNPSGPGPKLTKAQIKQQKAMEKEMAAMAQDMGSMFSNGGFGGQMTRAQQLKAQKAEQDLFKNAMKAFNQQGAGRGASQLPMITDPDEESVYPSGVSPRKSGAKVTGNSDIFNQVGIIVASCVILGAIVLVSFRYYKTRQYTPVADASIEAAPFRSL